MVKAMRSARLGGQARTLLRCGLFQRASIITGLGWLTATSARGLQRPPRQRTQAFTAPKVVSKAM